MESAADGGSSPRGGWSGSREAEDMDVSDHGKALERLQRKVGKILVSSAQAPRRPPIYVPHSLVVSASLRRGCTAVLLFWLA